MDPAGELATLTREEKAYLNTKKQITLCVQTHAPPFEFLDGNGEYRGIVADFYQLISRKIGVPFQVSGKNPGTAGCDITAVMTDNEADPSFIQPGSPYAAYHLVIATDRNALYINSLDAVGEKPVAMSTRAPFYRDIQTRYPDVTVIPVDSVAQGLEKVRKGEVFGLVDTAPAIGHYIQEKNLFDLKISGELPYEVHFQPGIRADDPILFQIVEKGDFVARYGGEEFSIVLPGIDAAGTETLARKILDSVQALKIPNQDSDVSDCLTVSLGGISTVPSRSLPAKWFINKADQLLYRAKENGRNRYRLEIL